MLFSRAEQTFRWNKTLMEMQGAEKLICVCYFSGAPYRLGLRLGRRALIFYKEVFPIPAPTWFTFQ